MKNKVLIVAVHPDDETLGCGGTLLKHKANGDEIHWLICTTIDKSHNYYETREKEIEEVAKLYNFDNVFGKQGKFLFLFLNCGVINKDNRNRFDNNFTFVFSFH